MRKSIPAAALALCASTAACTQSHAEDAGPTVSRNYQVGNFTSIESAGPYEVTVRTGARPSVSATGPKRLIDETVVEVRGDRLVIHPPEQHHFFQWGFGNRGVAKVQVTVLQLSGAAIAGSGSISVDKAQGDSFEGKIGGSGSLKLGSVALKSLTLAIGGSGSVNAGSGSAQSVDYQIAGSGGIEARGVQAAQANISIEGSGDVKANASSTAAVKIMGSGDVNISGGAKCSVTKAGSGSVSCS